MQPLNSKVLRKCVPLLWDRMSEQRPKWRIQGLENDQSQELEERCVQETHSFLFKYLFIYSFGCVRLSCGTRSLHFAEGFSLVGAHRLQNSWAQSLWHMGTVALWHVGS